MIVELHHVSKRYREHTALHDVSFSIPEGSVFALIGSNGAGKTTAIKILMNLIAPTSGRATVLGSDSRRLSPQAYARIGYVSENQILPERMRVGDYLRYLRPFYPTWDLELEADLLLQLRLPRDRRIGELSHGMRMKAVLACAMPFRPQLLVLDEPFSGLDPLMRDDLMETLIQQCSETTMLISSHELTEIETFVSHIGFMDTGRLLFQEPITELSARLREVRVTLEQGQAPSTRLPPEWLEIRTLGNVVSFIDTQFSESTFSTRLGASLGRVRDIDVRPLDLRRTFTTLARAAQAEALP